MTSERDELADWAYRGEVRGEALFLALAEIPAFADHRHELETLALLEAQTAEAVRPLVERLTGSAEPQEADRAIGRRMAAASGDYSWDDFLGLFAPTTTNAITKYRRLHELVDEPDRETVDDVIAHEEALQAYADASLRGDPTPVDAVVAAPARAVALTGAGRALRARALVAAAVLAVASAPATAGARSGSGELPARCGPQTGIVTGSPRVAGSTPVLLVHGFKGSPRDFAKTVGGSTSLRQALSIVPGASLYAFDYSESSEEWVTHRRIGPALADAITCLYEASGKKVVVVAHSMGGLAARFAEGQRIESGLVADAIRQVITIGTPNRGVILLSIANGEVSNLIVRGATELAGATCDEPPKKQERRDLCELLRAASIPAVKAMDPDSKRLKALPQWSPRLAVDGVAADLRLRVSAFGIGTTVSLGDIVVTVGSATADASPTTSRFVARCSTELTDLIDVVDESHCSHANELSNRRIVRHVVDQVLEAQAANRSRSR